MPLKKVKEFMGHKLIETTERYIHLNPEDLRDLAVTLEKFGTTFGTTLHQKGVMRR
jgi:integrase